MAGENIWRRGLGFVVTWAGLVTGVAGLPFVIGTWFTNDIEKVRTTSAIAFTALAVAAFGSWKRQHDKVLDLEERLKPAGLRFLGVTSTVSFDSTQPDREPRTTYYVMIQNKTGRTLENCRLHFIDQHEGGEYPSRIGEEFRLLVDETTTSACAIGQHDATDSAVMIVPHWEVAEGDSIRVQGGMVYTAGKSVTLELLSSSEPAFRFTLRPERTFTGWFFEPQAAAGSRGAHD